MNDDIGELSKTVFYQYERIEILEAQLADARAQSLQKEPS